MSKLFRSAILGAPAAGKGTISNEIVKKFDIIHVSTGDIFRQNIDEKTELGVSVQKYISEGRLVPDVLVMKIVFSKLKELAKNNWLCDGFPRTLIQAEKLFMKYPLDVVISLKVPTQVLIDRSKGRLVHIPSGRVYNTSFKPPKVPMKDDVTGEPLTQRPDDKMEAVLKRLEIYHNMSEPLLDYYKKQGVLKEFHGETSGEMWEQIEKVLLKYMKPKT